MREVKRKEKHEVRLDDEKEGSRDLKGENVVRRCFALNLGEPHARCRHDRASGALRRRRTTTPVDDDVDLILFDVGHVVATRTMHRGDAWRVSKLQDVENGPKNAHECVDERSMEVTPALPRLGTCQRHHDECRRTGLRVDDASSLVRKRKRTFF